MAVVLYGVNFNNVYPDPDKRHYKLPSSLPDLHLPYDMNPLLFLYLNLVRGPQIVAERQRKEAEAAQAAGPTPAPAPVKPKEVVMASCKKCDKQVDEDELRANYDSLCVACASDPMSMLSPVFIFQILLILVALAVFIYRSL